MTHRFNGDFSRLESEERKRIMPSNRILREMNIRNGDTIIDFGCGIGYFSIPALDYVGDDGKVIAVDVSDEMLQEIKKRAGRRKNLKIVQAETIVGLTANIVLLSMVLHEIKNPKEFLRDCFAALKPFGRVIVIDWQKKETGSMGPPFEERLAKEYVINLIDADYLDHPIHEWVYFIEFIKTQ
jgi:ubiquinone/menaquinone biosynthesis C-methylase UbiE